MNLLHSFGQLKYEIPKCDISEFPWRKSYPNCLGESVVLLLKEEIALCQWPQNQIKISAVSTWMMSNHPAKSVRSLSRLRRRSL